MKRYNIIEFPFFLKEKIKLCGATSFNIVLCLPLAQFELESDEYITIVEGTYDKILGSDGLTMLTFKTNKNRTYGPYGLEGSTHFDLKEDGHKITGFHGRAGDNSITAIGVYLAPVGTIPLTPATQTKKLEAKGGDGGTLWDDGAFDGVRKVSVGQAQDGIGAVKFVYNNGSSEVIGDEHGKSTLLGFEEVLLTYFVAFFLFFLFLFLTYGQYSVLFGLF